MLVNIYIYFNLCYNYYVVLSNLATERRCFTLLISFIFSVMASVAAYYICKWLDEFFKDD